VSGLQEDSYDIQGKSTLQNELVGDFADEFGSLPDNPEDRSLEELGAFLEMNFNGELGKQTSSLVRKMFSTKMPGGFNADAAKKHMETQWGLGPQRQQGVMLLATTMQPTSRFGSEAEAKAFLDDAVHMYATQTGIELAANLTDYDAEHAGAVVKLDSAALETLTKNQRDLSFRQFDVLAAHLDVDLRAADRITRDEQNLREGLQAQLDLWTTEQGDAYTSGITPKFDARKIRIYDSSWHWAREDVLGLHYDLVCNKVQIPEHELAVRKARIVNRATARLCELLKHQVERSAMHTGHHFALAKNVAQELLETCNKARGLAPVFKSTLTPIQPRTIINEVGVISYLEVPRDMVSTVKDYVQEMSHGFRAHDHKVEDTNKRSTNKSSKQQHDLRDSPDLNFQFTYRDQTQHTALDALTPPEDDSDNDTQSLTAGARSSKSNSLPHLHLMCMTSTG
jgi:fatty acid synthase subunit alpha